MKIRPFGNGPFVPAGARSRRPVVAFRTARGSPVSAKYTMWGLVLSVARSSIRTNWKTPFALDQDSSPV